MASSAAAPAASTEHDNLRWILQGESDSRKNEDHRKNRRGKSR